MEECYNRGRMVTLKIPTKVQVTFWKHDKRSIRQRKRARNLDEKKHHQAWNEQYKIKLDVPVNEIPTVFIGKIINMNNEGNNIPDLTFQTQCIQCSVMTKITSSLWLRTIQTKRLNTRNTLSSCGSFLKRCRLSSARIGAKLQMVSFLGRPG